MGNSFTVRDLPPSERPRERMIRLGPEAISLPEVLAIIIGSGTKKRTVTELVTELLRQFGDLKGIAEASVEELCEFEGLGVARATRLKAAFEVARRFEASTEIDERPSIKGPEDAINAVQSEMKDRLRGKKKEHFLVLPLDVRNKPIGAAREVSVGSLDASLACPREVFKEAISACSASVILIHNHPSGDPEPSEDDIKLTRRLAEVGELIGIAVTDHIIVGDRKYTSLKGRNLF